MKLTDIITQAQVIAGLNSFEGNSVDMSQMATSLAIFHQTLNAINNDPKITLVQAIWDYNNDMEGETKPASSTSKPANRWVNVPQLNEDEPEQADDVSEDSSLLFPDHETPFPISKTYPLPRDCRRVLKVMCGNSEMRKTDYSEVGKNRRAFGGTSIYAINNRCIELVIPSRALVIYVKEFKQYMPQDEVDLPMESLDYVINLLAYNLALSNNSPRVASCQVLAEKSYNALLGNLRVNEGEKYQNVYTALNRFRNG